MGAEEGDKGPEAENRPVSVWGGGAEPCPVLAFQAAVRLREEIRVLRGVLILNMVLHCRFFMWNDLPLRF